MMTSQRVLDILAAYGGDSERWPSAERAAALALIASDSELRAQLNAARALDEAMKPAALEPVGGRLAEQIEARLLDEVSARRAAQSSPIQRWAPMAAAAALSLGLGLGWLGAAATPLDPLDETSLYASAFGAISDDEDWTQEGAL
ncbi:MAG: hypothetical protein AAFX09_00260 [Pseudomonadota bacterium]